MNIGLNGKWGKRGKAGNSPLLEIEGLIYGGLKPVKKAGNGSGKGKAGKKGIRDIYAPEMEDFIKIFESERYAENAARKAKSSLMFFNDYMEIPNMGYSSITPEIIDGFKKYLEGLEQKGATVRGHIRKVRQFLSFVEKQNSVTIPALHSPAAVKPEGVENCPAEFREAYYEYARSAARSSQNFPKRSLNRIKFVVKTFYRYLEERHVERFIDIRRADIKEFTRYLMDLNGREGNRLYCASSVNIFLTIIRGFLVFLSKKGVCIGLADLIHCVKREVYLSKNILNRKELVKLFNVKAENPGEFMMKTIVVLLYGSGLRIGEVLALKFKDVNFEKKEASLFETKTNRERTVQLGEVAAGYLRLYIEGTRPCVRDLIGYEQTDSDYIFRSLYHSEKANADTVNAYLKKFCGRAGIKKLVTCHCFRHSFGTHFLENGAGIKEVSELLGHEDLTTTERYTHLNPERLRQTILKYHPRETLSRGQEEKGGVPREARPGR